MPFPPALRRGAQRQSACPGTSPAAHHLAVHRQPGEGPGWGRPGAAGHGTPWPSRNGRQKRRSGGLGGLAPTWRGAAMLLLCAGGQGSPFGGLDVRYGRDWPLALRHHACRTEAEGCRAGGRCPASHPALPSPARRQAQGAKEREAASWGGPGRGPHGLATPPPTLHIVLEELLCAKLEDVIQLLLGHGARLGAEAGPHHQVGEHHLALGHLRDALLHRGPGHKAVDHHLLVLPDAVGTAEGLGVAGSSATTPQQRPGVHSWVPRCKVGRV